MDIDFVDLFFIVLTIHLYQASLISGGKMNS